MDELLIYQSDDGKIKLDVRMSGESVWLTQEQMSILFGRERSVITKHINHVFEENELNKESNVQILHIAGIPKPVTFYNLGGA